MFLDFDKNGDGKLSLPEFKNFLATLLRVEVTDKGAKNVFDELNKDNDGFITVDEWLNSLEKKSLKEFGQEDIKRAFEAVDTSKDGKISRDELKAVLKTMRCQVSEADLDAMIKVADKNHDNQISFQEFSELFFKNV